jgi:hypothetical protein
MVAGDRNDIFADAVIEFLTRAVPADGPPARPPQALHSKPLDLPGGIVDVP